MRTTWIRRGAVLLALLALAGCGSSTYGGGSSAPTSTSSGGGSSNAVLTTAGSALGKVVVDAHGRTVYVFDKDTAGSGTSACTGDCLAKWPPVAATSGDLTADGVTGKLGTITRDDGTKQITLDGKPLYLFGGDTHAGDVTGQSVGGLWWAVSPDGTKITGKAPSSSSAAPPPAVGY